MTRFFSEIYSQPDVIARTAEAALPQLNALAPLLLRLRQGDFRRILFTGMGSSFFVLYPSLRRLAGLATIDAQAVEAAELLHYRQAMLTPKTLLIIVSQSGRSAEIPGLLELARNSQSVVLGVTNTPGSILAQGSHHVLTMQAGEEATVSTKTYTCTLALLHLLTTALLGQDTAAEARQIVSLAGDIRARLDDWRDQMSGLAERWKETPFIEYLGRGHSMASVSTAALISKESIKLPTEGQNAGQFRHGPIELVDARFTGVLFWGEAATHPQNFELARDIIRYGGQLAQIGQAASELPGVESILIPACAPALLPLPEIIPVQLFCGEMSIRRGYAAGQFRYIGKVTVNE
jgi:glucosamine--fructose-6-phosphate aminotransferase (isomerizing)